MIFNVKVILTTGKVILDSLGLDVEVYYTSEIDQDSLLVTSFHYGDTVTPIGDVTKLTEEKVRCPTLLTAL